MLRALLAAAIDDCPDGDRRRHLSSEHRPPLGGLSDYLVHRQEHEIHARVNHYWAIATECRSERRTGAAELRDGRVDHALAAELAVQVRHRISDVPRAPESLADREHLGMVREQILEAVANGSSVTGRYCGFVQCLFAIVPLYTRLSNDFAGG